MEKLEWVRYGSRRGAAIAARTEENHWEISGGPQENSGMSDDKTSKKKGGRSKKWILLSALILVLGGMGAAGGFFAAGMLGRHANAATEDPNRPKLVLKGEGAPAGEGEKAEPVIGTVAGDGSTPKDASKYQAKIGRASGRERVCQSV